MRYICPVCGYPELSLPPEDYTICPSCGTEFGYDDFALTPRDVDRRHAELRREWFERGASWFDPSTPPPLGWDPVEQLMRARTGLHLAATATTNAPPTRWVLGPEPMRVHAAPLTTTATSFNAYPRTLA